MVKHIKFHVLGGRTTAIVLVLLLAGSLVVTGISIRAQSASHSSSAARATQTVPAQVVEPAAGPMSASIQLASHELTPSSHFNLAAAGFASKEQLTLTVLDAEKVAYDVGTLQTDTHGKAVSSSLPLPSGLASGDFQLIASGVTSHRTASAPFRMHDIPPLLHLDNYYGTPGQAINFTGSGFFPGETVSAFLGASTTPLVSAVATDLGAVSGHLTIPSMSPGAYDFSLIGKQSQIPATVRFSVQRFSAWVVLDRYALMPGQTVGFIGHGFAANEPVFAYLNSTRTDPVMRLQADTSGQVVVQDSWVPDGAIGDNVLSLIGQSSKATATAQFTILLGPDQPPTPGAAPAGP